MHPTRARLHNSHHAELLLLLLVDDDINVLYLPMALCASVAACVGEVKCASVFSLYVRSIEGMTTALRKPASVCVCVCVGVCENKRDSV